MKPIILSKRNLLALLHKLIMKDSHRTLVKPGGIVIKVEPDEVVYADRAPGEMHPETEEFIRRMGLAMDKIQAEME